MIELNAFKRARIDTGCTVTVKHTDETLEAHVELDDGLLPSAADHITVFGAPVRVQYGDTITLRRQATLTRATPLDKLLVRLKSLFLLTELYEVSFSPERLRP